MREKAYSSVSTLAVMFAVLAAVSLACSACESHEESRYTHEESEHAEHEGESAEEHAEHGECENMGVPVKLSSETAGKIGLVLAKPTVHVPLHTIELTGRVNLNEDRTAHISPRAEGTVKQVNVVLGQQVEEGDVLALLDSSALREAKTAYLTAKATEDLLKRNYEREKNLYKKKVLVEINSVRAEYLSAKATAELFKKNYEREKTLFEKKISAEKDLVEAETEYKKALIDMESTVTKLHLIGLDTKDVEKSDWTVDSEEIEAHALSRVITEAQKELYEAEKEYEKAKIETQFAEAKLHLLGLDDDEVDAVRTHGNVLADLPIRAPFAGTIIEKHASLGENVGPESELFVLADLSVLWVQADVYEKDIARVEDGMDAIVTCTAHPQESISGKVSYVHHLFDEHTSKGKVRVEVPANSGKLKPGMFVKVTIDVGKHDGSSALYLPAGAVQNDGTCCDMVFVNTEPNTYVSRKVSLGVQKDDEIEITAGLKPDDMVVVRGGFSLKSEVMKAKLGTG